MRWIKYGCGRISKKYKSSDVPEMGDHLATVDIGRKVGAAVPLYEGGAGSPSNTMLPGLRSTSVPLSLI